MAQDSRVRITVAAAVFLAAGVCLLLPSGGCHSLRTRRQTRELAYARQNSLRGVEKLQQNKLQEAEFLFTEALRKSSVDERAQAGMAEVLWQRGESDQAIQHMTQAAMISGGNPDTLVRLGEMNFQQGRLNDALYQADQALENQRRHAGAWALRGKVLHQQQRLEDAMSCYHRALSEQPQLTDVQLALAEIYRELGRPQRALATLDALTDGKSGEQISPQAWMLKGQALADLGETSAARGCLKNAALCCQDGATEVLLAVAQSQIQAGDFAEARMCLGRAFRQDPHNPQALQLQALLEQQQMSSTTVPTRLAGFEQPAGANPP